MTDSNQYLRLVIGGVNYLLPGTLRYTIEQRDGLVVNDASDTPVAAWRTLRSGRWPAYALDGDLRPSRAPANWQRALFLEASPGHTVGMVVEEVHMLARGEAQTVSFTPPGPPPTTAGHLFSNAWVNGNRVVLVFEARALIAYLQGLGG